jgi:hypothetical protein
LVTGDLTGEQRVGEKDLAELRATSMNLYLKVRSQSENHK